ncbi:VanW family protein [Paenibacillus humicus]|uniref:VanW family protein n=1 Tax=Paenibacillus humicus TaxID=412861 RepID=UPI003F138F3E
MKRLHLMLIILLALLLAACAAWGALWIYGSKTTVPSGTEAGGLPLGGLPRQEALRLLQAYGEAMDGRAVILQDGGGLASFDADKPPASGGGGFAARLIPNESGGSLAAETSGSLTASASGSLAANASGGLTANASGGLEAEASRSASWTLRTLGFRLRLDEAEASVRRLATGSAWSRAKYRWQWDKRLPAKLESRRAAFDAALRRKWGFYDERQPVDAVRTIGADDRVVYTPGRSVLHLDLDRQFGQVRAWAALGRIAASEPQNELLPSARSLKGLKGKALLKQLGVSPVLEGRLQMKAVLPKVTLASLREEGIDRLIASFTTDYSASSQGRAFNVSETARTLNGWLMKPGDVFDYGEVIRITERETGYREAPVILNGQLTPGIGGGICQVSSTLYNAVLLAGLDIVERRNHSLPVSYLPLGRDATFADGVINFRFRNSTGKHILIQTSSGDGKLTVKLYGTLPPDVNYEIRTETVRSLSPAVQLKPTSLLAPGESQVLTPGKKGYVVDTYRIRYVKGKETSRLRISRDTYKAQPEIVGIGQQPGRAASPSPGGADSGPAMGGTGPEGSSAGLLEDGIRLLR